MGCGIAINPAQFIKQLEKAIAGGVATLDTEGKVPKVQIDLDAADVGAIAIGGTAATANQLTTPRTISITGDGSASVDFDGSANVSGEFTLATVNSTPGNFGSTTQTPVITVDEKGRITLVSNATITPSWGSISGLPANISFIANSANNPPNWHTYVLSRVYGAEASWIAATINSSLENTLVQRSSSGSITGFNLTANNEALVSGTTQATSTTTGALRVPNGGASVGGNLYVGGIINGATFGGSSSSVRAGFEAALVATGTNWSAFGANAGRANTTGTNWSAFGVSAGFSNTTGNQWSAFGANAGRANTTGTNWSAFGANAGRANTTGTNWSAFGVSAGFSNTTGTNWSAFGVNAGLSNTTGTNWSAFGVSAGFSNTTGSQWSAFGVNAGRFLADGVTGLTVSNNSCYFGADTKALQDNVTNENVFGFNATGNGSNTVTIGDSNITETYLRGNIFINGTQSLTTRRTGWASPTGTATRTTFATDTVTLIELARRVKGLVDDLITHGLIGA